MSSDRESAIDEAAGELTAGEPGHRFTTEVMARIESGDVPSRTWRAAWAIVPLAAAVTVMIAMFAARGPQPRDRDPKAGAGQQTPPAVARDSAPDDRVPTTAAPRATGTPPPSPRRGFGATSSPQRGFSVTGRPDAAEAPRLATDIPRLEMPRLTMDTLTQPPIPPDPIDVISPITVTPLEIDEVQRRQE